MSEIPFPAVLLPLWLRLVRGMRREGRFLWFFSQLIAAAVTPKSYRLAGQRRVAQALCFCGGQALPGYALFSILFTAVTTHLVAVGAASHGLSHLALEGLVRVFVVELIPLAAALFVAMRSGIAMLDHLVWLRARGERASYVEAVLPGFLGNLFATLLLTITSTLLALGTAYLVVHGLTPWGIVGFSRLVGQVFDPVMLPGFLIKTLLFGLVVGAAPTMVVLDPPRRTATGSEMRIMVRLFLALVLIEGASLVVLHL